MFETLVLYSSLLNITTANSVMIVTVSVISTGLRNPRVCKLTSERRTKWRRIEQRIPLAIIIASLSKTLLAAFIRNSSSTSCLILMSPLNSLDLCYSSVLLAILIGADFSALLPLCQIQLQGIPSDLDDAFRVVSASLSQVPQTALLW
ncbi:hypothetical protein EDD22DRAFT_42496 [Suillus occidentalis]|nr:hypothetical protein EDD22DRAFT_42496 [Suillus occidentalis]